MTTPAHLLLLPLDNKQIVNFFQLTSSGLSLLKEATAFRKITVGSKALASDLSSISGTYAARYKNLNRLFLSDTSFLKAANFASVRPHTTLAAKASLKHTHVVLDKASCDKFLTYNNLITQRVHDPLALNRA